MYINEAIENASKHVTRGCAWRTSWEHTHGGKIRFEWCGALPIAVFMPKGTEQARPYSVQLSVDDMTANDWQWGLEPYDKRKIGFRLIDGTFYDGQPVRRLQLTYGGLDCGEQYVLCTVGFRHLDEMAQRLLQNFFDPGDIDAPGELIVYSDIKDAFDCFTANGYLSTRR